MQLKKRSPGRRLLFSLITVFLLLLVLELIARAYYYNRLNNETIRARKKHPIALVQLLKDTKNAASNIFRKAKTSGPLANNKNHYLVRPNLSKDENDQIAQENRAGNKAVYSPWVEFSFKSIQGKYVNVSNQVRKSVPDLSDSTAKEFFTIFFLGGSTMYGYNVTDAETIPAGFVRAYQKKYPAGKPIRVVNFGTPYYYSYQELMFLANKLFRGEIPGMVIMLDGLNDGIQVQPSMKRESFFKQQFQQLIDSGWSATPGNGSPYKVPAELNSDSVYTVIYQNYLHTIATVKNLTAQYTIPLYCFVQPVPFYQYDNQQQDPICSRASLPQFAYIYSQLEKKTAELNYLFYLGNLLQHEKGLPYIDHYHYSPSTNSAIAEKMLEVIKF